jgi:hypothetical protein
MKFTDPWGFSKLQTYNECPRKFAFQYVQKVKAGSDSSPALQRGSEIHEACEAYINGWDKVLDARVENWEKQFDELRTKKPKTELAWGFDKDWNRLSDWFQPETWLRAKCDAVYLEGETLHVIDFKTGKYKVPPVEQIELYAICGASVYPQAATVIAEYWFLDSGNILSKEFTREYLTVLRNKYENLPLFHDEVFAATPSRACAYCSYSGSKDGPCDKG